MCVYEKVCHLCMWVIYVYMFVCEPNHLPQVEWDTQSLNGVKLVWIQNFSFSKLFALPRLNSTVCLHIYIQLQVEEMDSCLSAKWNTNRIELGSLSLFFMAMNIAPCTPHVYIFFVHIYMCYFPVCMYVCVWLFGRGKNFKVWSQFSTVHLISIFQKTIAENFCIYQIYIYIYIYNFFKEGNILKTPHRNRRKPTLLDGCMDWCVIANLDWQLTIPMGMTSTHQHPDLFIWSINSKKVIMAELTIPFNNPFQGQHWLGASVEIGKVRRPMWTVY